MRRHRRHAFRRLPIRLHEFPMAHPMAEGGFGVASNAVRALRYMCDGDGYQLLRFGRQSAVSENRATECLKGVVDLRSQPLSRIGR